MSLLLNGAKTAIIAGTVLQCVEVYNGESYTLPFAFTDQSGTPIDITGWTLSVTCKWYHANISYPSTQSSREDITLSNLTLISPQPTPNPPSGMTASIVSGSGGTGYVYIPTTVNGGQTISIADTTSLMCIINLSVSRTNSYSKVDTNIEPIGIIIRYI